MSLARLVLFLSFLQLGRLDFDSLDHFLSRNLGKKIIRLSEGWAIWPRIGGYALVNEKQNVGVSDGGRFAALLCLYLGDTRIMICLSSFSGLYLNKWQLDLSFHVFSFHYTIGLKVFLLQFTLCGIIWEIVYLDGLLR